MRAALVVAVVALAPTLGPARAHADRREASLHAEAKGGVLATGDVDADATDRVPLAGVAVRASYATRDSFQYDVSLALLGHGAADFPTHTFMPDGRPPVTGPYRVGGQLTRLDAGVTFRLGVAWIPTVRVAAGVQLRRLADATVTAGAVTADGRGGRLELDLVGTAAVGLDRRLDRRLIVGAAIGGVLGVPVGGASAASVELTVHGAYYWYPRW